MRPARYLALSVIAAVVSSFALPLPADGQLRTKTIKHARSSQHKTRTYRITSHKRDRDQSPQLNPSLFEHACYKLGASFNEHTEPLNFATSGLQWDQPDGPGSDITLTYSYSNLLDGEMQGLAASQLRQAVEEALSLWASSSPINFVEIEDVGPDPSVSDSSYAVGNSADIRFGAHVADGPNGAQLAHAFLPFSNTDGLAGDLHFDIDEDWSLSNGGLFLETALHEIGHCLGLDHEDNVDAIMNPFVGGRFSGLGTGFLLADDIAGLQAIYGTGTGSVTPLAQDEPNDDPNDDPGDDPTTDTNDVAADLDSETGLLTVSGDSLDNSMLVYSSRWLTIVWGFNDTTVNGDRGTYWFHLGERTLEVTTGDGADTVYLYGVSAESANIDLGQGDDTLAILFSRITTVDATPGDGDDRMLTFFSRIGDLVETGFETVW